MISFKAFVEKNPFSIVPGAYDCISAKIIEQLGFQAAYMTGFGVSASLLGYPDYGFLTMTEMATRAKDIAKSIKIPLIADADTGYGNLLNVKRTVEEYEQLGVSAIHIEDQVFPKKCGHFEGKQLISMEEHGEKLKSALNARKSEGFGIIARTDAASVLGIDEAIKRAKYYQECGVDAIFIDTPTSEEDIKKFGNAMDGIPIMINMVERKSSPQISANQLKEYGYHIILYPVTALLSIVKTMQQTLSILKVQNDSSMLRPDLEDFDTLNELLGIKEVRNWETSFSTR